MAAALAWLALCGTAQAAARTQHFRIPAGALDDALCAYARQSGMQLLYRPELVARRRSPGLDGEFSAEGALARLLRDSGLQAEAVAPGTFVLHRAPPAPARATAPLAPVPLPATELGTIEITGTHIRRTALEPAGPLTVIDRQQIERSGYQTLYELLRAQPGVRVNNTPLAMADGALYQANGLSGATGAGAADLHGLGPAATLFLIDGQRMAPYPLAQGEFAQVNDLDAIPLPLVERIEILRDGASAVYGSDAMAGVVNIILRKRFSGVEVDGQSGLSSRGDAAERRGTVLLGGEFAGGGHAVFGFDYFQRDPLLGRQRDWARAPAGAAADAPAGGDDYYFDGARVVHEGSPGCLQTTLDGPCTDQAAAQGTLQTALDSRTLLLHLDHPLAGAQAYLDLRWNMLRQRQQMAPASVDLLVIDPRDPASARTVNYAFDDLGPVRDSSQARGTQLTLGLGDATGVWRWDAHFDGQRNEGSDRVRGLLSDPALERALDEGSYVPGAPDNPPAVLAALSPVLLRRGSTSQSGASARLDGPLAEWPAGPLSLAAGVETYRERMDDHPDPRVVDGDVFQFQPPYQLHGERRIAAAYAELEAPLTRRLTANLAGRLDHSSGFGSAFSPRLGLKWDLGDSLSLRGTVARGYRAPTLPELNRPEIASTLGVLVEVPDALLPCRSPQSSGNQGTSYCLLQLNSVGNPRLQPERSRSYTLGLVLAPTPALGIALDASQIERYHEIGPLPVSWALDHPDSYPQLFQRDAGGTLYGFDQQLVNLGRTSVRTYDLDLRYRLDTARRGGFDFNLGLDWLASLRRRIQPGEASVSYAGYAGQPRLTGLAGVTWTIRDWSSTANLRYTGHYAYTDRAGSLFACPDELRQAGHCETPAFVLLDLDLDYTGFARWRLGLHVRNLLDHRPTYYGNPPIGFNPAFDDVAGRYFLLSFRYRR